MNEFEIEFNFENQIYKATFSIHEPIQYHVTQISPHSEEFPEVIMFIWNDDEKMYNWANTGVVDALQNRIKKVMLNTILNKLDDLNITRPKI